MVPLPAGVQIEDGGAAVFTTRHGDEETARAVDQLSTDNSRAVGDRIPFGHLLAALSPLCCEPRDDMTVLPFTRWAIVSAPGAGYAPSSEQDWTGPARTWPILPGLTSATTSSAQSLITPTGHSHTTNDARQC